MKRIICALFFLSFWNVPASFAADSVAKQTWMGKLSFGGMELTLVLNVHKHAPDSLTATLDSPDQGATGIPVNRVRATADSLEFIITSLRASYKGRFSDGKDTIKGIFSQAGYSIPLSLSLQEHEYKVNRPQEPRPPFGYQSEEVVFRNTVAGVELSGTLTRPSGKGPFPAIVLVTGSGPENRDEEIFGHKPFLVLADRLTREGFAVLRYDDRGYGKSTGDFNSATTLDFAADASSAVDFLKNRPDIDTSRIGMLGHSEGGLVAEIVAAQRSDLGFILLLAGPALKGEDILRLQAALIARASGIPEDQIRINTDINDQIYSILKKNSNNEKAAAKIRKTLEDMTKKHGKDQPNAIPAEQIASQIKTVTSPWFRTFLTLDPVIYIQKIRCPVFALYGELDLQVAPAENMHAMETGLLFSGNDKYTIEYVPGVNHLFQTATTGSPSEYGQIEETISPVVLDMITRWLELNVNDF